MLLKSCNVRVLHGLVGRVPHISTSSNCLTRDCDLQYCESGRGGGGMIGLNLYALFFISQNNNINICTNSYTSISTINIHTFIKLYSPVPYFLEPSSSTPSSDDFPTPSSSPSVSLPLIYWIPVMHWVPTQGWAFSLYMIWTSTFEA